ncbi:MAG TPA: hypothetical protein VMM36_17190, partial [Opitutaceae bacterium]|nr:hypothetical protein [Opitutaceae bacterium]
MRPALKPLVFLPQEHVEFLVLVALVLYLCDARQRLGERRFSRGHRLLDVDDGSVAHEENECRFRDPLSSGDCALTITFSRRRARRPAQELRESPRVDLNR